MKRFGCRLSIRATKSVAENSVADSSMIRQHFEHPDGATAVMESPQLWNKRCCYYTLTVYEAGKDPVVTRRDCDSPQAAREAAIARARHAMGDGWRFRQQRPAAPAPDVVVEVAASGQQTVVDTREAAIQRGVELVTGPAWTMAQLWDVLAEAFPVQSARQEAVARVLQIQQERRDAESRQRRAVEDTQRAAAVAAVRPRGRQQPLPAGPTPEEIEAATKRLAGGVLPGERQRRRINLGG
jgi:hypothetical protein